MGKLELKHIAPYLPYGLQVQIIETGNNRKLISVNANESVVLAADDLNPFSFPRCKPVTGIKLLLHPLSDLYKEIDGEIPADILFPKEYYSLIDFYEEHNRENQIKSFIKDGLNWSDTYSFWEYLLSKHFDVFSLIDKGLAIDLNSISHE
ncbi:hypothetical protein E2605_07735 [Dysgonomonas capnocytophagoides]|uniref:Uncharacterized protein n=1 Tax=Dysgonomonas capnocytophagoides TaxID=45254 RepID=A0A4Y8L5C7_9BACT|nr:hypothetical protein [Dysgonomonas capnocytophagoides]TFD96702.1 hypothetical protein E2605_07735 [Dysgonomonas capnocytophagoides]